MPLDGRDDPQPPPGLSDLAMARMAALGRELDALRALSELASLLDPQGTRTRWSLATDIAERLRAFEGGAWRRIRSGGRAPRDSVERLLCALASGPRFPRDPRRLWDLLANRA